MLGQQRANFIKCWNSFKICISMFCCFSNSKPERKRLSASVFNRKELYLKVNVDFSPEQYVQRFHLAWPPPQLNNAIETTKTRHSSVRFQQQTNIEK